MHVQVKPPPPPVLPMAIPLGFFSVISLIIIFGWAWSEFFLLTANDWTSLALGIAVAAAAYFAAFRKAPLPVLFQALAFGLFAAVALFRLVTIHETSDADALGGVFCGFLIFFLVSMEQYQLKK